MRLLSLASCSGESFLFHNCPYSPEQYGYSKTHQMLQESCPRTSQPIILIELK